jgi:uncharacterized membrane protein
MPTLLAPLDLLALAVFFAAWAGYGFLFDRGRARWPACLNRAMDDVRAAWMQRMLERENRVMDSMLIGHLINSVSFFASATVLVLAGLVGVFAAADDAHRVVMDLGIARTTDRATFELKLLLLLGIFIFAFFKFTWALRQFNYTIAVVGAAPPCPIPPEDLGPLAQDAAALMTLGVLNFNAGLRAYYFAFASLGWLIHPAVFIGLTLAVVAVLARRQVSSAAFRRVVSYARRVGGG